MHLYSKAMANRTVRLYKDYFKYFYISLAYTVRNKINYCINVVKTLDRVPSKIVRYIEGTDGLYEIRVEVGNVGYSFQWISKGNTENFCKRKG